MNVEPPTYRVAFGPDSTHRDDAKWHVFNCNLDGVIEQLRNDHIESFRIHGNQYPNEHELFTDGVNNFAMTNHYAGFDMWCLNDNKISEDKLCYKYLRSNCKPQDPALLNSAEFKKYCEILCTQSGEYGHIYLSVQRREHTYEDVWK